MDFALMKELADGAKVRLASLELRTNALRGPLGPHSASEGVQAETWLDGPLLPGNRRDTPVFDPFILVRGDNRELLFGEQRV